MVDLDGGVIDALLGHRLQQDAARLARGRAYIDHGLVFAREDGNPIAPSSITKRIGELVVRAGLPMNRVHGRDTARRR